MNIKTYHNHNELKTADTIVIDMIK